MEIVIPTLMCMHTKYWTKRKEMHTRHWNWLYTFLMHSSENIFSSVFYTTAFCFRPQPGTLSLDRSLHADFNFRLAKPQYL